MVFLPRPLERKLDLNRILSIVAYGLIVAPPELIGIYRIHHRILEFHHRGPRAYCGLRTYWDLYDPSLIPLSLRLINLCQEKKKKGKRIYKMIIVYCSYCKKRKKFRLFYGLVLELITF